MGYVILRTRNNGTALQACSLQRGLHSLGSSDACFRDPTPPVHVFTW